MSGLLRQRPSAFAIGLTVVGIALFVRLGFWQLDRARDAQHLLDAFAAAASAPIEEFAAVAKAPPEQRYPHVRVRGRFAADRAYLRDEQLRNERLGVEAYGVFAIDGEPSVLLVDRGWRAWTHAPSSSPEVPPPPSGEVELTGTYAPFPGNGLRIGGNRLATQATWPKLTLAVDRDEIADDIGKPLLPRVLLLDADAASGFERRWTPAVMPPARHQAYAFQWFAFAVAALALFVVRHRRKTEKALKD